MVHPDFKIETAMCSCGQKRETNYMLEMFMRPVVVQYSGVKLFSCVAGDVRTEQQRLRMFQMSCLYSRVQHLSSKSANRLL